MIKWRGAEIVQVLRGNVAISSIRKGLAIVWQSVRSCFGSGMWRGDKMWRGDEKWKGG